MRTLDAMAALAIVAALHLALADMPSHGQRSCNTGSEVGGNDGDSVGLLQSAVSARHLAVDDVVPAGLEGAVCPGVTAASSALTATLVPKYGESFAWWSLPAQPQLPQLHAQLTPLEGSDRMRLPADAGNFASGPGKLVAQVMYEATKVDGVFEHVPSKLKGVFWMKGNGIAEELMVFQYGKWFEEEHIYISTMAPFTWAWPMGKPKEPPMFGLSYSDGPLQGIENAGSMVLPATTVSFHFSACPATGHYCHDGPGGNMSYAYMQMHTFGDLSAFTNLGDAVGSVLKMPLPEGFASGAFTLEEVQGSTKGSRWKRTCYWGFNGCAMFEFGSYDLVRIIDGEGKPVEPYHSDFVKYMGSVDLLVWSGWANDQQREAAKVKGLNRRFIR